MPQGQDSWEVRIYQLTTQFITKVLYGFTRIWIQFCMTYKLKVLWQCQGVKLCQQIMNFSHGYKTLWRSDNYNCTVHIKTMSMRRCVTYRILAKVKTTSWIHHRTTYLTQQKYQFDRCRFTAISSRIHVLLYILYKCTNSGVFIKLALYYKTEYIYVE